MLVGYCRVSKSDMNLDRQVDALLESGVNRRCIYQEKITGTKRDREQLNKMLSELQKGETVVVTELTRLGRSTRDLFDIIDSVHNAGAQIKSLNESWLDTTTPQGKLLFTIFAGLSQFERDLLSERTKDGLKAAKARGRSGGRPSKINEKGHIVRALYNDGIIIAEIVRQTGLSRSTVNRIVKDIKSRPTDRIFKVDVYENSMS